VLRRLNVRLETSLFLSRRLSFLVPPQVRRKPLSTLRLTPPGHRALSIGIGGPVERLSLNEAANSAQLRAEIDRLAVIVDSGVCA
jgi:hypothetical protein